MLLGDGLPWEVAWRSSRRPSPQIARHPHLKPNHAGPGATEPGKGPESTEALAALSLLPTHHLTPGRQAPHFTEAMTGVRSKPQVTSQLAETWT